jgi:hypothetical protein
MKYSGMNPGYCSVHKHGGGTSAGILKQSMGARNRVGIGLSYRSVRLHRLAESIPGLLKSIKIKSLDIYLYISIEDGGMNPGYSSVHM